MLFPLGHTFATPAALDHLKLNGIPPSTLMTRHITRDWGDIQADDRKRNDEAVTNGSRLLSAYKVGGERVYIITEWDRSSTTLLLASEY